MLRVLLLFYHFSRISLRIVHWIDEFGFNFFDMWLFNFGIFWGLFDNWFAFVCSAFCSKHKPYQKLEKESWRQAHCAICLDSLVEENNVRDFLKMPCCNGNYMHRKCLQVCIIFMQYISLFYSKAEFQI